MAAILNQQGLPVKAPSTSVNLDLIKLKNLPPLQEIPDADFSSEGSVVDVVIEEHSKAPKVQLAKSVTTAEERLSLIALAARHVAPSLTVDDEGNTFKFPTRSSYDVDLTFGLEDITSRFIQYRMTKLINTPLANAEPLVALRYRPGQEYKPHRDYLPPSHYTPVSKGGSGQREHTVITFLQAASAGGETVFPELKLSFSTTPGDCLIFGNLLPNGEPDPLTLHAGKPVLFGEKWIATLWVHQATHRRA
jgi:prolyl 4-hydroxylase